MWVKTYQNLSGHLLHDARRKTLFITLIKKGKVIAKTAMNNINIVYARYFVKNLSEEDLKQILNTNMEVL